MIWDTISRAASLSSAGMTYHGESLVLVALNNSMRDLMAGRYPRIDLNESCPGDLKNFVKGLFEFT